MASNMERLAEKVQAGRKGIRLLFIHQNFPSQYRHVATHYAADEDNTVVVIGQSSNLRRSLHIPGAILMGYEVHMPPGERPNNPIAIYDEQLRRGQAVAMLMEHLRAQGFVPDVICVHPHWGEGLYLDLVYPGVPVLAYGEYYNHLQDPLFDFDPLYPATPEMRSQALIGNTANAVTLATATHVQTPTHFQFGRLPLSVQCRTSVMHEGIDTQWFQPPDNPTVTLLPTDQGHFDDFSPLPDYFPRRLTPLTLTREDKVVTYVSRTLEPLRGWVSFIRAVPLIQAAHPDAHIVVVGRTGEGYGPPPPDGKSWRDLLLDELHDKLDLTHLHFPGTLPYESLRGLYAVSGAHVYLTYPYVVSHSAVEAMSMGAPLVFSDTAPVREIAGEDEETAIFVDFHSPSAISDAVNLLLNDPDLQVRLGKAARRRAVEAYDMQRICLPKWIALIEALARGESRASFR